LWIAQIVVDTAFAAAQILLFSIMVYFMCGLVLDAGAFFTFYLMIVSGYLAMTLFFRTVGCLCPDFDYAMKFAAVIITLFVLTSVSTWTYDMAALRRVCGAVQRSELALTHITRDTSSNGNQSRSGFVGSST
jgi:hypothetical protein